MTDPLTPNIRLILVPATSPNWAQKMNDNLTLLDAVVGSYFSVNNLQGIWRNRTEYAIDDAVVDVVSGVVYKALVAHTSASAPTTFSEDRVANPSFWGGYTSPARARGPWTADTAYTVNDFVVSGPQYAICVQNHTSGSTFAADVALGYWSILIDLSSIGSSTLPALGGLPDGTKFVISNPAGVGYNIYSVDEVLTFLGATSVGLMLFQAGSAASALAAIGGQPAGSYQPLAASLSTLSGFVIGAFADELLSSGTASDTRTILGLTTLAVTTPGAGVATFLNSASSANLLAALSTKTGTGLAVFGTAPTLSNPIVGTQTVGDNSTKAASTAFVGTAVAAVPAPAQRAYAMYSIAAGVMTLIDNNGLTLVRNSTGKFTGTLSPAMTNAKYRVHIDTSVTLSGGAGQGTSGNLDDAAGGRVSASSFKVMTSGDNVGLQDPNEIYVDVSWG